MSVPDSQKPDPELAANAFNRLVEGFTQRISGLFDQMVDILLGMAEKSGSLQEQHLYFDAMRMLRGSRNEILSAFQSNLKTMSLSADDNGKAQLPDIDDLALVTTEAMDENVTLTSLAQRISNRAGDEVQAMFTRLESLGQSGGKSPATISPELALRALEEALRHASLEFETRRVVYQVLEKQAVHSLANVYAEMNQWLVNQGVMVRIPVARARRDKEASKPQVEEAAPGLRPFSLDEPIAPVAQSAQDGGLPGGWAADVSAPSAAGLQSFVPPPPASLSTPWLGQQLEALTRQGNTSPISQSIARMAPTLTQVAAQDSNVVHDRRHPMRRAITLLSDLIIDLESEDGFTDIGEEIARMVALMESRAASGPGFWLHVIKYLQYIKDEMHNRLWGGDEVSDHQEKIKVARRLATRQIQLQMRGKRVTPALHRALSHLIGPGLAILLLRHRHERDSIVLRSALQLLHEVIESVQELPDTIEDMHYLEHASGVVLLRRLRNFLKTFAGFDQAVIDETIEQLHGEHLGLLDALEARNQQQMIPVLSIEAGITQRETTHLPPPGSEIIEGELVEEEAQAIAAEAAAVAELPEPDMAALDNLALDALLERLERDYRFAWFQIHVCEGCILRRLMFSNYDAEKRTVTFVNVRQEPSVMLSVVDFDTGLRAGLTKPIFDDPDLQTLVRDYAESRTAPSASLH